jgi:hypothetical protein
MECRIGQRCQKGPDMILGHCQDQQNEHDSTAPDAGLDAAPAPGDISL